MIEELKQKEFEKNQAQKNLEKMRDISVQHLNQDLDEWERLWEKHSSRNSFERFVNTKPSYVQGVFWDQFEFKEQRVNAGRIAMNQILVNGGTMQEAKDAYNKAAATQRIELIEMNAQFNVKHNLADYEEQQIFNSTGQIHLSPATKMKLAEFYADYNLQPSYVLANSDDAKHVSELNSEINNSNVSCEDGYVLVSRLTTGSQACVDESTAKKWTNNGIKGIVILDGKSSDEIISPISRVKTNPGTQCEEGYQVIYHVEKSEYQCVLESVAKEMIENNTAEIHTLVEYILNKDKQKITEDTIHEINQEILSINKEYEAKKKALELKYGDDMKLENSLARQRVLEIIKEYRTDTNLAKEDVTKHIAEIKTKSNAVIEKIFKEKLDAINRLDLELKNKILEKVRGYENNPDLNVDWNYLNESSSSSDVALTENEEGENMGLVEISSTFLDENNYEELHLNNIGVVNSFGQKLHEIKSNQVLQVTADVTNPNDYKQNFIYMVKITDDDNNILAQPTKWITGVLDPNQTFNAGLSWIPKKVGDFKATISVGTGIDAVVQVTDVEINVNS